uniref:Uncharacterized protein TCIL3000_10_13800 n=1 Tax=Trypanosoma congolense (strain IL3000) TaxID=1068625 RepID=G0UYX7_TRYCI|nr:unnamed protein product [Trypanosoma congolense IL3000]
MCTNDVLLPLLEPPVIRVRLHVDSARPHVSHVHVWCACTSVFAEILSTFWYHAFASSHSPALLRGLFTLPKCSAVMNGDHQRVQGYQKSAALATEDCTTRRPKGEALHPVSLEDLRPPDPHVVRGFGALVLELQRHYGTTANGMDVFSPFHQVEDVVAKRTDSNGTSQMGLWNLRAFLHYSHCHLQHISLAHISFSVPSSTSLINACNTRTWCHVNCSR